MEDLTILKLLHIQGGEETKAGLCWLCQLAMGSKLFSVQFFASMLKMSEIIQFPNPAILRLSGILSEWIP
jgi:hypothetical protein